MDEGRRVEPAANNDRLKLTARVTGLRALWPSTTIGEVAIVTRNQDLPRGLADQMERWHANGWRTGEGRPIGNADLWAQLRELAGAGPRGPRPDRLGAGAGRRQWAHSTGGRSPGPPPVTSEV